MITVVSLLQYIQLQGSFKDKLYLVSVIPESIANKADVSSEFCWGKDEDRRQFLKLIKSECSSSRYMINLYYYYYYHCHNVIFIIYNSYTWEKSDKEPATCKVEGVKYSLIKYARVTSNQAQTNL